MNFLIGWIIGDRVGRSVGAHNAENGNALWGLFLWWVIGWAGSATAYYNIDKSWSGLGGLAAVAVVLAICLHRPFASGFKQMMLNAIAYGSGWVMLFSGGYIVLRFGYAVIFGQLKTLGLAALPISSLVQSAVWFVAAFAAAFVVGFVLERDRLRIVRASERFHPQAAAANPHFRREEAAPRPQQSAPPPPPPAPPAEDAWWTVLETEPDAAKAVFEAKARALLKQYHPDLWMTAPPRLKSEAERQTQRILRALEEARAARRAA